MTPSLEGLPTKAKEAPSPHEIRLAPLDTSPVFQSLGVNQQIQKNQFLWSPINSKIFSHMISSPTLYQEKFSTAKTKTKNWWIRNRHSKKNQKKNPNELSAHNQRRTMKKTLKKLISLIQFITFTYEIMDYICGIKDLDFVMLCFSWVL